MPSIIPLTDDSSQTETIVGFDLFFYWNVRDNSWRMSITQNSILLIQGVKLVVGIFLLRTYSLNIGDFIVLENSVRLVDPTREGFVSGQFTLLYFNPDEVASELYTTS